MNTIIVSQANQASTMHMKFVGTNYFPFDFSLKDVNERSTQRSPPKSLSKAALEREKLYHVRHRFWGCWVAESFYKLDKKTTNIISPKYAKIMEFIALENHEVLTFAPSRCTKPHRLILKMHAISLLPLLLMQQIFMTFDVSWGKI